MTDQSSEFHRNRNFQLLVRFMDGKLMTPSNINSAIGFPNNGFSFLTLYKHTPLYQMKKIEAIREELVQRFKIDATARRKFSDEVLVTDFQARQYNGMDVKIRLSISAYDLEKNGYPLSLIYSGMNLGEVADNYEPCQLYIYHFKGSRLKNTEDDFKKSLSKRLKLIHPFTKAHLEICRLINDGCVSYRQIAEARGTDRSTVGEQVRELVRRAKKEISAGLIDHVRVANFLKREGII